MTICTGKIKISDAILNKPGKLTDEEFEIMKTRSELGKEIIDKAVSDIESDGYLQEARNMAAYHHERWDGKGTRFDPRCVEVFLESLPEVKDVLRRLNPEYKDEESNEGN